MLNTVLERIEELRQEMYETADAFGIDSQETMFASQKLDIEINHYYRLKRNLRTVE